MSTVSEKPRVIAVNRKAPLNFKAFGISAEGWSIYEQDDRSVKLGKIDLNKISFETRFTSGPIQERLNRLATLDVTCLDVKILETILENRSLIPESWEALECIHFEGTTLINPNGWYMVMRLCYDNKLGRWHTYSCSLDEWSNPYPSAVLRH